METGPEYSTQSRPLVAERDEELITQISAANNSLVLRAGPKKARAALSEILARLNGRAQAGQDIDEWLKDPESPIL